MLIWKTVMTGTLKTIGAPTKIAASNEYNNKQRTDAIKERNKLPLTPDGNLITALKKQILLNNIYGVDIDAQAVEVTKLSLMLKCMEGETNSSITAQMQFGERILPTLDDNIKSGNSLIDVDFYDGQIDFEPGIEKKVKPFSWQQAFPKVFTQGGFDAVIGNPPYGAILLKEEDKYFRNKFQLANYQLDTYILFVEKGSLLLKKNGRVGYIIPTAWTASAFDIKIRKFLSKEVAIDSFIIAPKQAFKKFNLRTMVSKSEKIEIFYHVRKDGSDNFKEITQEISRHFRSQNKKVMRRKIGDKNTRNIIPQNTVL
jgi:hypothetical protein